MSGPMIHFFALVASALANEVETVFQRRLDNVSWQK
jgi:hypothetical protein